MKPVYEPSALEKLEVIVKEAEENGWTISHVEISPSELTDLKRHIQVITQDKGRYVIFDGGSYKINGLILKVV